MNPTTNQTAWVDTQAKTLDEYITNCMLAAEATIHRHNLEDFSPKKLNSNDGKILETCPTGQPNKHTETNTPNGCDHDK
jgi:hypothetical protein